MGIWKKLMVSLLRLMAIALCWQGMYELYKFDEADIILSIYLFVFSFCMNFQAEKLTKKS